MPNSLHAIWAQLRLIYGWKDEKRKGRSISLISTLLTSSGSGSGGAATNIDLKWAQIKKLTISGTSYAGATATLFAVRK